jgi:hypothetical protein
MAGNSSNPVQMITTLERRRGGENEKLRQNQLNWIYSSLYREESITTKIIWDSIIYQSTFEMANG